MRTALLGILVALAAALPAVGQVQRGFAVCYEVEGIEGGRYTPAYRQTGGYWHAHMHAPGWRAAVELEERLRERGVTTHKVECDYSPQTGRDSQQPLLLHYVIVKDERSHCCELAEPNGALRMPESVAPFCTGFGETKEDALLDAESCIDVRVNRTWASRPSSWRLIAEPPDIRREGYSIARSGRFLWYWPARLGKPPDTKRLPP